MHTLIVLASGFGLLAACLFIGRMVGLSLGAAALAFVPLWFVGTAINMWVGVTRAGYSIAEEFPIFLGLFSLPTVIALAIWWKHARS